MKQLITILFIFFLASSLLAQTKKEPVWWQLERDGKYLEAASHLIFMAQSDSTRNQHADYLHAARMYGYLNDYEKAMFYWKKSFDPASRNDEQFEWYFKGTLAFFERDKETLGKYYKLLEHDHTDYYESNYRTLKSLYKNFDKGYLEASSWK